MNGITANDTLLFKDVVGGFQDFTSTQQFIACAQAIKVHVMDEDGTIKTTTMANNDYAMEVYGVLIRHFRNYEIAYDSPDDFLDRLWERIEIYAPNYFIRKSVYDRYMSLTDKELIDNGVSISNFVEHTDDEVDDVWKPIKHLTNQSQNKDVSGIAARLRQHINTAKMTVLKDFLKQFDNLFISLTSCSNYYG